MAGGLALLPGLFLPYLVSTDTFAPFAVIGGLLLLGLDGAGERTGWVWVGLGALTGLAHLTRADGFLLALVAGWTALVALPGRRSRLGMLAMGYLAVMAPWWIRNLVVFGAPMAPGTTRALWLLGYDELFSYPPGILTGARWLSAGVPTLLRHRLDSALAQVQTILAVNGYVVLLPAAILGAISQASNRLVRFGWTYVLLLLGVMTIVFPFAGARGGFFHSSAAVMPLVWALTAIGLDQAGGRIAERFGWSPDRTRGMLASIGLITAAGISLWGLAGKSGAFGAGQSFDRNAISYGAAARAIPDQDRAGVVAVNDPPGYYLATGSPAVSIPGGDESSLRAVAERYGVSWVLLEFNHPQGLDDLYRDPTTRDWLAPPIRLVDAAGQPMYLFRVLDGG